MSPVARKILNHEPSIIKQATLSIGQLNQEAQDASNKTFKITGKH